MGIRLNIRQISDEQLEKCYKEGPEKIPDFTWEKDDEELDLDKMWNLIHFLLTGTNQGGEGPASYLLTGKPIIDLDDCLILSLSSQKVVEFDSYLQNVNNDFLKKQYNHQKKIELEIYPSNFGNNPDDLEFLMEYFEDLKAFVSKTAKRHKGLTLMIAN